MKYIKHIPNILTIIRFIFVPIIVLCLVFDNYLLAIITFTVSSITDVLDGIIARKFNVYSGIFNMYWIYGDSHCQYRRHWQKFSKNNM